jgi:hypothetical protein
MRPDIRRLFLWMTVFFASMAFLESAVVVYLRALYYPDGFAFPLVPMDSKLVGTEVFRELATMLMLLAPGALVVRNASERFAWFCFGFGVWDIFYYVWLKVLLDWPSDLGTFDLLFLIPAPWVGPVWAPCIVSIGLVLVALVILYGASLDPRRSIEAGTWAYLTIGALSIILSFVLDPLQNGFGPGSILAPIGPIAEQQYVPRGFPWPWFVSGCSVAGWGLWRAFRRMRRGR